MGRLKCYKAAGISCIYNGNLAVICDKPYDNTVGVLIAERIRNGNNRLTAVKVTDNGATLC